MLGYLKTTFKERRQLAQNRSFLKAAMAACAMVSISEGQVNFCDRITLDQILTTLDQLKTFDPHEGVNLFNDFSEKIRRTPKLGRQEALAAIKTVTEAEYSNAELLIRLCLAISLSDGETSLVQKIEIISLCSLLEIDPKRFNLDIEEMLISFKNDE